MIKRSMLFMVTYPFIPPFADQWHQLFFQICNIRTFPRRSRLLAGSHAGHGGSHVTHQLLREETPRNRRLKSKSHHTCTICCRVVVRKGRKGIWLHNAIQAIHIITTVYTRLYLWKSEGWPEAIKNDSQHRAKGSRAGDKSAGRLAVRRASFDTSGEHFP